MGRVETKMKTENGITLIALVITIIVLLILAGVSIAMLTGENGILTQAQKAKNQTDDAQSKEETTLGQYESYINRATGNSAEVGKIVTEGNKPYTNNGTAIIPESFMIVPGCDDVSKGLVISDNPSDTELDSTNIVAEGNQFVWIPVTDESKYIRNINYPNTAIAEKAYTDIGYLPNGIQPSIDDSTNNENAEKQAVLQSKGFYISRYEAGNDGSNNLISQKGVAIYNNISQEDSKTKAKTFINNENVKSALCSGIQWDVVMDFVNEKLDGNGVDKFLVTEYNANRHLSKSTSGQNEADKVCNIYDLEGNYYEYVAEKNSYGESDYPYVGRGGIGGEPNTFTASNRYRNNGLTNSDVSFRFVLYVM